MGSPGSPLTERAGVITARVAAGLSTDDSRLTKTATVSDVVVLCA